MGQSMPKRWITAGLLGALLMGTVPADWNTITVFAASDNAYVTTVKEVQQEMAEGLGARKTSMTIKYKGNTKNLESLLKKAINGALDSDPYTKYIVDRYTYSWRGTSGSAKINLSVTYRENAEQSAYVTNRVSGILKDIISPGMNDHEKVKAIHDFVVQNLKYDEGLKKYTAYEGLRTGEAVCQGYTLLTYKLLEGAGINNVIVEGTAGGQLHAWNLVELEKKWYHLDTTWDDPISAPREQISYAYYLRTDEQMRQDHQWISKYPAASSLYRETLSTLVNKGGAQSSGYKKLQKQLGYHLYDPSAAVSSSAGLQTKVRQELQSGGLTVTVRYSGTEQELLQDLESLYDLSASLDNIQYLSKPLEGTEDLRVEIHWETR
ncbi:transglutaminase [Paenibacillus sp. Marseille-P2973]|uniref:transglutaminase domain-containing protein n=1 Tax=Paenibacillus sp. Marseille-P2973 TaxID=1871032 RepID=UPI001B367BD3|nr:transglutaminase domain-containing protein [Paenibacillus sp. Marseille-P2973]MBQ4901129.1 transglutaminase [Paenibacillus sp. Marseille-P2973]